MDTKENGGLNSGEELHAVVVGYAYISRQEAY
jgi:hypothetical protein